MSTYSVEYRTTPSAVHDLPYGAGRVACPQCVAMINMDHGMDRGATWVCVLCSAYVTYTHTGCYKIQPVQHLGVPEDLPAVLRLGGLDVALEWLGGSK